MSDELKPCPFCGSDDVGLSRLHESRSFVMCNGCGAEADDTNTLPEASAADVWNRRVDDPLRTQLAAMTAERDALQTSMNELRKTCAEIIGADPQTWPDHGNAPLAIAACLGLRDAELQKTTAERDAALAKVAVLREALQYVDWRLYFDGSEGRYVAKDDYDGNVIDAALEQTR